MDRPGALQSTIFAGHVAPPRANPQEIAQQVLNTVLGGQFISRLNMNLREDKHWSYGAGTIFFDARGPRPFIAYAPVQTDKTKESVAEIAKELKGIGADKPVTAEELQTAKDGLMLTLAGQWETAAAVAGSIGEIVRFAFPDDYYATFADRGARDDARRRGKGVGRRPAGQARLGDRRRPREDRGGSQGAGARRDPGDRRRREREVGGRRRQVVRCEPPV